MNGFKRILSYICLLALLFPTLCLAEYPAVRGPTDALFNTNAGLPDKGNAVASGANDFAFRLSAKLLQQVGDGNFICSPCSVWLPLAALVHAAKEPHKTELLDALGASGIGEAELNQAAARMLYDLTNQESERIAAEYGEEYRYNPLKIANAVFVNHSVTLNRNFSQVFMDSYRGVSMELDFSSPQAAQEVNRWASESTEGMIPEIVQEFSRDTLAVIANAVYFADRWSWEFSPDRTEQGTFHAPTGETGASFMLREGRQLLYYEDDTLQAMPLAFETGGRMLILLPKDGDAAGMLASMTNALFQHVIGASDERPGKLLLPRFSIESNVMEISDPLASLGIPLFNQGDAPLIGLVEGDAPLWISDVLHKAAVEVDERGTTAAAVTIMALALGAPPPDIEPAEPFEMICDRPFAFILYGHTRDGRNQVLFTGVVNQPQ